GAGSAATTAGTGPVGGAATSPGGASAGRTGTGAAAATSGGAATTAAGNAPGTSPTTAAPTAAAPAAAAGGGLQVADWHPDPPAPKDTVVLVGQLVNGSADVAYGTTVEVTLTGADGKPLAATQALLGTSTLKPG